MFSLYWLSQPFCEGLALVPHSAWFSCGFILFLPNLAHEHHHFKCNLERGRAWNGAILAEIKVVSLGQRLRNTA
ncbi:hypothetical protein BDZ91DRAFT_737757 [Kalaharituber pfeilii]|nr:hypothetical protein BDZ91DRAFT_737757 [Kalaharituber pfeilii]